MFIKNIFKKRANLIKGARETIRVVKRQLTGGSLEAKSSKFNRLFPPRVRLKKIATGFQFTEGPIWFSETQSLLFSDIPANRVLQLSANGKVRIFRQPSGNSNGLTRDHKGRLIACEHSNRRITRTENDGSLTVLTDSFQRKRLNSPNDVVVKRDGSLYFTDPPYGIQPNQQEQSIQGVYRLSPDDKELKVIADDFDRPNGLAFSPDEKKLYVADSSSRRHLRVFDVQLDGTLGNGRLFHDMNIEAEGVPDGMKVDEYGHIFCTGPRGIWVLDSTGRHLGTILTPEQPANCAWGDQDFRSLYITARTSVYKIRVNIPGAKTV